LVAKLHAAKYVVGVDGKLTQIKYKVCNVMER
jgi:hypothetical protein